MANDQPASPDPVDGIPGADETLPLPDTAAALPPATPLPPTAPDKVKFTRAGALWTALIIGFLVLIVLLVFILQNTAATTIHFFVWQWDLPVGVALLFSAVCGGLLTVAVGTARIYQLRRQTKKALKAAR